ncbi:hypothetical protein EJB05_35961, partial [Eragrostis curvula]
MSEMNMCWVDGMLGVDGPAGAPVVGPAGAPVVVPVVVPAGAPPPAAVVVPAAGYKPPMRWTAVNSGFVLRRICDLVGKGARTDKGFKEVHVNQVAKLLKEFSGENVTATQVYNHLRKWRQRWGKVCKLKDLSSALWDEDTCSIVIEHEHYLGHIKDHPKDAEFLNRPIEFYNQMQIAFGSTMATGRFAMGSGEALGVFSGYGDSEGIKIEGGEAAAVMKGDGGDKAEAGEASKTPELAVGAKRKRTAMSEEEALLVTNMIDAVNNVAAALRETAPAYVDDDLYDAVMGAAGFTEEALMVVYSHLLDNKAQGRGYIKMNDPHRVLWLRTWLGKYYYN